MDCTPVGEAAGRDEPVSAFYVTARVAPVLLARAAASGGMLARRAAGRADHLHLPDVDAAGEVFGVAATSALVELAGQVNAGWWRLDVDRWEFKLLRYRHGHYAPAHVDMFPGSMRRKVTMVVQLTDPGCYVGGDLEVVSMGERWATVPRQLGLAAVFPAWTRHRVTLVEGGERWSLAVWGYGPPVR